MSLISQQDVTKYQLPNGLTILLEKNSHAPVVSINIGVKIGSVWEKANEAGLSHLIEHMVFKGTSHFKAGEIAKAVETSGGELNAYTSFDQTVYYINIASRYWKKGLSLIKEMAFDATIDALELKREKEVVLEEIRRGKDNPNRMVGQMLFSLAFQKHPYGRPVIGYNKTVKSFTQDQVFAFYKRWYIPSNMVLGVCGDFNMAQIKFTINNLFGSIKSKKSVHPPLAEEPRSLKARITQQASAVQGSYLCMAYPIPHCIHKDIPALDLLAQLLGDGDTSRLVQNIKEKKGLVNSISAYAYTPHYPGLFIIDATLPQQNILKILPAVFENIDFCKNSLFPEINLDRAKKVMLSHLYYEKETCEGTARKWMIYETTVGDYKFEEKYLKAISSVSTNDLQYVANKYLGTNSCVTALLHPENHKVNLKYPKPKKTTKRLQPQLVRYKLIDEFSDIKKYRLSNGIFIITRENHRVPLVSIRHASLGGLRHETRKNNGITNIAMGTLEKGTTSKTALQIAEISESIAGHVSGLSGRNTWGVSSSFLSSEFDKGIDLFCDVLLRPAFSHQELKKEKRLCLEAIKNQEDSLGYLAVQQFQNLLYKKHPYGMPLIGKRKSVSSLTRDQITEYYKSNINPKNMVISCIGDFKSDHIVDVLADELLSLKPTPLKLARHKPEKRATTIRKIEIKKDKMQAHIVMGFLGTTLMNKDRYALEVLNNILAGQGGRLFLELRDKRSMAYSVSSMMTEGIEPGIFAAYIGTDPTKVDSAISGILTEFKKIQSAPVSKQELERSKNYIIGNYDIDLQKNSSVASVLALNSVYGYGLQEFEEYSKKIMKVTAQEVLETAKKYLTLNAYTLAVIKP